MTAIKQKAVTTHSHVGNLGKYLNAERALMRDSQHIVDDKKWDSEMERTREAYGHNTAGRAGATTTFMYHQVIAFNPDECSCNAGKMTPERCMEYAQEYVSTRYPNQEAIWVLHKEHCKADGTDRYAVHIGINRTDLETGRRLAEGRGQQAKIARANAVRDMDAKWNLRQLEAGKRNSRVHALQPTRAEKEMAQRGVRSDKQYLRDAIRASVKEVSANPRENNMRALAESLDAKGVKMSVSETGRGLIYERKSSGLKCRGYKLGRGYSMAGIAKGLGLEAGKSMTHAMDEEMAR